MYFLNVGLPWARSILNCLCSIALHCIAVLGALLQMLFRILGIAGRELLHCLSLSLSLSHLQWTSQIGPTPQPQNHTTHHTQHTTPQPQPQHHTQIAATPQHHCRILKRIHYILQSICLNSICRSPLYSLSTKSDGLWIVMLWYLNHEWWHFNEQLRHIFTSRNGATVLHSNFTTVFNCPLKVINLGCSKSVLFHFKLLFPLFPQNHFPVVPL